MKIQIEDLKGKSAYHFCRCLLPLLDGADEKLEVYSGDTLSYYINSIKEGAKWVLSETSRDGFVISKYKEIKIEKLSKV